MVHKGVANLQLQLKWLHNVCLLNVSKVEVIKWAS